MSEVIWCDAGWFPHYYGFCPSKKAWDKYNRNPNNRIDLGAYPPLTMKACTSLFRRTTDGCRLAIVTIADFPPRLVVDLLVHEATHVWQDVRGGIGEDRPSSEFEAYAVQNIAANLFKAYEKTRGRLFLTTQRP